MGPWRAAETFLATCQQLGIFDQIVGIRVDLYGSLAKTGKGHGTDQAVILGLLGINPESCNTEHLAQWCRAVRTDRTISLAGTKEIEFDPRCDIVFHFDKSLPFHPNGMCFSALLQGGTLHAEEYFSVGGGFIVQETHIEHQLAVTKLPFPIEHPFQLLAYCREQNETIPRIVWKNEATWRSVDEIRSRIELLWQTFLECVYKGCHTEGILPGGLEVRRRAAQINKKLLRGAVYDSPESWLALVKSKGDDFQEVSRWVSCFALAVNEENASFSRVVTAPTNGAAGVIPSVLLYLICFCKSDERSIEDFILTAGEIGSLFKKGATISAAMGGCQAEIGVSSAMAAAGLTQCLGGTVDQVLMAAEIAMEHHLGLTCDPIGGLVQIPCIERNTMGAIKAITAANIAMDSDPSEAKVSLDTVIKSMWETALDMNSKYKETSEGGLALLIPVNISEC